MNTRNELIRDVSLALGLVQVPWEKVPVNDCPDDDPLGEPRPMKLEAVPNIGPFIDYLLEQGWTKP